MFDLSKFRIVNDFPTKGIKFYDITTVMNDSVAYREAFDALLEKIKPMQPDVIVALETRGFFFGPSIALALGIPFVPIRKAGKLPYTTFRESYTLEYATATMEIHTDAIEMGKRVVIFDDILATGGSAATAIKMVRNFNPSFVATCFLMELQKLEGRKRLECDAIESLITIDY